ncbi:hypothetical protein [Candidatus Ichthyocystis sparus]|uniref:hypothetical protein n=1 Tax=Candidatus Ichthyocystis sparus TaxID=1561004 RepID=UPI00159EE07D|nr:hypothetical protein [Candidatus Ichthyocystis sparus]
MVEGCAGEVISVLGESVLMVDILLGVTVVVVVVDKSSWFGVLSAKWIHGIG